MVPTNIKRLLISWLLMTAILFQGSVALAELNVVATLPDLAAVASEVGGDKVKVRALAKPTEDPHYVDPRPNLILALNKADMLVVNGLELEVGWLPPLQSQARNGAITVGGKGYFDASTYVRKREVPTTRIDRAMGDIHPGGNPHFMFDPNSAGDVARGMARKMGELDPGNAASYRDNAERFVVRLQEIRRKHAEAFAALPLKQRKVVSYHRSLPYLLAWLGLEEVATVEPKPGIPPNPKHVAKVLQTMKADNARVIVQEEFYPTKTSNTLAKIAKGRVVVIDGGTRFDDGESYLKHVDDVARDIYQAIEGG